MTVVGRTGWVWWFREGISRGAGRGRADTPRGVRCCSHQVGLGKCAGAQGSVRSEAREGPEHTEPEKSLQGLLDRATWSDFAVLRREPSGAREKQTTVRAGLQLPRPEVSGLSQHWTRHKRIKSEGRSTGYTWIQKKVSPQKTNLRFWARTAGRMRPPLRQVRLWDNNEAGAQRLGATRVSSGFLLDTVLGWTVSPRTCENNLIWKRGLGRCNQVKTRSRWIRMSPKPVTGVFIRGKTTTGRQGQGREFCYH